MRRAAAILLLLGACRNSAPESACPHDPGFDRSKVIRVRAGEPPAVLRRDLDLAAIARESAGSAAAGRPQGLTEARWLPARGNPLEAEDRASAEAALDVKLRKVVTPVYEKYKADLGSAQGELDKPELYQWVSKRCDGWK